MRRLPDNFAQPVVRNQANRKRQLPQPRQMWAQPLPLPDIGGNEEFRRRSSSRASATAKSIRSRTAASSSSSSSVPRFNLCSMKIHIAPDWERCRHAESSCFAGLEWPCGLRCAHLRTLSAPADARTIDEPEVQGVRPA